MTGRRFVLALVLIFGLNTSLRAEAVPVIVKLAPLAKITKLLSTVGGTLIDSLPGTNIHLLNLPALIPNLTARLLGIEWLELNTSLALPRFALPGLISVPGGTPSTWYKTQPSWQLINASDALAYSTGSGVIVADINSSVDSTHPALQGHLMAGYDFVASKPPGQTAVVSGEVDQEQSEANMLEQSEANMLEEIGGQLVAVLGLDTRGPAYSHGTMCAGIIAGIAPGSMVMTVRAFDDNGKTDLFTLAKAIRWSVDNGARVINMSFGTSIASPTLLDAIDYARNAGVVLVASAGNSNASAAHYPSGYAGVISTAATDLSDKKADFSNYGSTIFVDAPGSNIFGPYPNGSYTVASGTSFAAPTIAGTAALILSLRSTGLADSIANGSINIDSQNPEYATQLGHGRIDVLRAVGP